MLLVLIGGNRIEHIQSIVGFPSLFMDSAPRLILLVFTRQLARSAHPQIVSRTTFIRIVITIFYADDAIQALRRPCR